MAIYRYSHYFKASTHAAFDEITYPGNATPYSGIYRCEGCGVNIVSTHSHPMPPQNHHQHTAAHGSIRWRLIAATH